MSEHFLIVSAASSENEDDHLMGEPALASAPPPAPAQQQRALPPPPPLQLVAPPPQLLLPAAWRSSLPAEQHEWVSRALFVADRAGRPVLSPELQLWHHPPGPRLVYSQQPSFPDAFFQRPFFLWAPYKMWTYHLKCPNCAHKLTGGGLYKTVRRVLDLDGWYYMGTEYLECSSCTKKCASWSESIRSQLDLDHQLLFPAVLTYRLSCDRKVLAQMKGRTLGNSASRLHSFLVEQHTAEWMRRSIHYLNTCRRLEVVGVQMPPLQPPPQMVRVPSSSWLLSTFVLESFTRIEELKAKVTSTFGSILKMGSTKKVTKKLAGAEAGTALCMSSVGNELGQVLMSVLTAAEGYGLRDMARGLQERYQLAGMEPPQVLYVDRDCCRRDGGTCATAALFPAWPHLAVRLDTWHFMRRLAAGVTSASHPLYPEFMRRLSSCIFEWDAEDLSLLETALQADGSRRTPSSKEMGRHCRRRTRGAQETERLLGEVVEVFKGATDTKNVPLLERRRVEQILETQRHHIPCIQDPAGVPLYTRTGQLTRGGVSLPVYRCARGSTSLHSFHLHLHRFIPGSSARGSFFHMFLLEGLTRWNEDRGKAAAGAEGAGTSCYSGQEQHTLHQLTQHFFQSTLVESYVKPLQYTGELIGISYLYNQTGKVLQPLPEDPDELDDSEEESTTYNRLRLQKEQAEAARRGESLRLRAPSQNKCSSCEMTKTMNQTDLERAVTKWKASPVSYRTPKGGGRARTASKPLGSALAAFVSGRRSLSAVEMQAKIQKLVVPKPAFPASLGSALPSKPSEEPSDEELIRAVVDMEEYVQAPLSFHPPPATPSSAPQKGAGVSAVLGEPTDEELLEATQEQDHALRPPAVVQTAPAPSSLPPPAATASPGAAAPGQDELPGQPSSLLRHLLPVSWRAALTVEQQQWIGRMLFTRDQWGRPSLITDLNLWWNPPQSRPIYHQPPASPDPFFACRLFLWMPHWIWRLQLTCPQPSCTGSMVKAGLYRTIRRVLDIDGWYLMATEYLECRRCKKKVGGWSQGLIRQLAPTYSCQFPAVLTYKLSCDQRVVTQLKSRTLGNSATQLVRGQFPPPPIMPTLPSPIWLLTVYGYDIMTRLDEYKVTKKLAGTASDTAAWVTNVGNEYGQVLISVLTCSEGAEGLSSMAAGLMRRYRLAGVPPPQLIYVDRDCCNRDGVSKTAALFQEWGQLVVRLDIWHLMRRFAAGVTTESHELYPAFMRQLSLCIFEVDPGDARRLTEAKRSQLEGKRGMVGLTDAEVIQKITREEWRLHCRRRTRGAEDTALLLQDLHQTFGGTAGRDNRDIPLLDPLRIQDIWSTQRPHLSCIQDPPGVQLYTQTGRLTKGGVILPVYRCARGSTSLESFHLHLNRFIPGTQASAKHFQVRESGHLKHALNQKSQRVLGRQLVKDFTKPAEYTGELIGVEFLYRQTGKVLEDVSLDPDIPDEAAAIQSLEEVDEGIEEDVEDPTVFQPDIPSTSTAARSGDPADAHRSEPSGPAAPHQPDPPEAPEAPAQQSSSDSEEEIQGPDGQPGYQHVLTLAKALLEARSLQGLSDKRVDELMVLWQRLPEPDRQTPGEAAEGAVQDSEGEEHLLSWEGESPTLSSRAELGPCNMAQRQPPGRGHLQPALPSPPRGHAVRRDHEDSVVPHPHGLRGH
ncbi:hypothetical protein JOQ06_011598 [Pogonophryne albipinna]|uniref:DUF6729 domain-containing protein n=1 Tax=Pogonophryne albipinna TaxID=1090488 RepID=A0AAD6FNC3_9TELE|nr:hypothetical protein JOQ06_011598 [Pogonophryne albipinna]